MLLCGFLCGFLRGIGTGRRMGTSQIGTVFDGSILRWVIESKEEASEEGPEEALEEAPEEVSL